MLGVGGSETTPQNLGQCRPFPVQPERGRRGSRMRLGLFFFSFEKRVKFGVKSCGTSLSSLGLTHFPVSCRTWPPSSRAGCKAPHLTPAPAARSPWRRRHRNSAQAAARPTRSWSRLLRIGYLGQGWGAARRGGLKTTQLKYPKYSLLYGSLGSTVTRALAHAYT